MLCSTLLLSCSLWLIKYFQGFFDEKMWSFETSKINFFVSLRYRLRVVEVDLEKNWIKWVVVLHNWMEVKCGH